MFGRYFKITIISLFQIQFYNTTNTIMRRESINLHRMASNSIAKDITKNRLQNSSSQSSTRSGSKPPSRKRDEEAGSGLGSSKIPSRNSSSAPVDMSGELAQFVKDTIKNNEVVIFSKTYCPYCTMAKDPFIKLGQAITVIELDKRSDGDRIQDILKEMTGVRTVPRVFFNGECIGGGTDVKSLYENGTLSNMIVKKT